MEGGGGGKYLSKLLPRSCADRAPPPRAAPPHPRPPRPLPR